MTYCLNPNCQQPRNSDQSDYCQSCAAPLRLNNRYRALRLLGQESFRRTFLAIDEQLTDPQACVIKQFLPHPAREQQMAMILFQQEAQRLSELGKHPQIPDLLNAFSEENQFYWVQEYIPGLTLEQVLADQGAFTETQIWQLLADLLPVLKFIHDRQVIHRDIKPANIISRSSNPQTAQGALVLVDFGAAKVVTSLDGLRGDPIIGSAEYVAPEQARGKAVFASDLYSLGVTCIHLLTGLSPFDLIESVNNTWVWQQFLNTPISPALSQLLDHLIQPMLSQRFQSADAAISAMLICGHGEPAIASKELESRAPESLPVGVVCHCSKILTGHTAAVNGLAISPDGKLVVSGSSDKTVRLWDLETGQEIRQLLQDAAVWSVTFNADGTLLAIGCQDKTIPLWEVASLQKRLTLSGHTQAVKTIAFHPQHPFLASGSGDKTIRLWDVHSGKEVAMLSNHRLQVNALAFSPDGRWLASGSSDRTVCLWRVHTLDQNLSIQHQKTLTDHVGNVLAVAFSPDSQTLATGGDDRTIKLWDVNTGQLRQTLSGHSWSVSTLCFSSDPVGQSPTAKGFLISGGWDGLLKLWPITETGIAASAVPLAGHTNAIHAAAIRTTETGSPFLLLSGSRDQTMRIWQA